MSEENQEQRRRTIRCSLCNEVGHNVRSCRLFETVKINGIKTYQHWLYHCIVGYSYKWDYSNMPDNEKYIDSANPEWLEEYSQLESLTQVLEHKIDWMTNISDLHLKALIYGYQLDKNAPKESIIQLLHYNFICEADKTWMQSYEVSEALPYIIHSTRHIDYLEQVQMSIFQYLDFVINETTLVNGLHTVGSREEKVRTLHNQTKRLIRHINVDMERNGRKRRELQRSLIQIQSQLQSTLDQKEEIVQRKERYLHELSLFPEGIIKPLIEITNNDKETSIDCPICLETVKHTVQLNCKHHFCIQCILNTVIKKYNITQHKLECGCPICRTKIVKIKGNVNNIKTRLNHVLQAHRIHDDMSDIIA